MEQRMGRGWAPGSGEQGQNENTGASLWTEGRAAQDRRASPWPRGALRATGKTALHEVGVKGWVHRAQKSGTMQAEVSPGNEGEPKWISRVGINGWGVAGERFTLSK